MKTYGGVEVQLHTFLVSELDGSGQLQASAVLLPEKRSPITIGQEAGWAFFFLLFSWGETESPWYCGHCFTYCTSPR
jgi:hypothetical protein